MFDQLDDPEWRTGVKLFVSHSHVDKPAVRAVAVQLRALGYSVWFDEDEIVLGDRILTRVEDAVDRADYLILFLSQDAVKSPWVDEEWRTKFEQQLHDGRVEVIPVIFGYERVSPPILRGRLHLSGSRLEMLRDAAPALDLAIREHERRRAKGIGSDPAGAIIAPSGIANLRSEFVRAAGAVHEAGSQATFSLVIEALVAARVVAATAYDTGTPALALTIYEGILADGQSLRNLWNSEESLRDMEADVAAGIAHLLESREEPPGLADNVWTARMVFDDFLDYLQAVDLLRSLDQWHELMLRGSDWPRQTEVFEPIRYAAQGRADQIEPMREPALEKVCEIAVSRARRVLELLIERREGAIDLHLAALLRMCRACGTVRTATETVTDAIYLDMMSMGSRSDGLLQLALGIAHEAGAGPAPKHLRAAGLFDWALSLRGYRRDAPYWEVVAADSAERQP